MPNKLGLGDADSAAYIVQMEDMQTTELRRDTFVTKPTLILGFHRGVNEIFALLGCYAA